MGRMRCVFAALVVSLLAAWAQSPVDPPAVKDTALENSGKPMLAPFECTEEDIQSFGLGCSEEEPCPIFLELSAFAPVGNQLFAAGNIPSAAGPLFSILLASAHGGETLPHPVTHLPRRELPQRRFTQPEHRA